MPIHRILERAAQRSPHSIALRTAESAVTFQSLADQTARLAGALARLGLGPGDRMGVLLPNGAEAVVAALAAWRLGVILVPLSGASAPRQNAAILADTGARALVVSHALRGAIPEASLAALDIRISTAGAAPGFIRLQELVDAGEPVDAETPAARCPEPDPLGLIVYTSGTTGRPKGIAHSQARLAARAETFVREFRLSPDDVALTVFAVLRPLCLVHQCLAMLLTGGCMVLAERPASDAFWKLYNKTSPTYCIGMPSYIRSLLSDPAAAAADHSRLRFLFSGGDQAGTELCRAVGDITGRRLLDILGMTEAGALFIHPADGVYKPGSIGKPTGGVESRLVGADGRDVEAGKPGRLLVRSPNMMVGYWNDTLATHRAISSGWLETRDVARADADGYHWFVGRAADVIVRNAVNVATAQVVEALTEHPAVAEAAVAGRSDPNEGQVPVAFYRLRAGAADPGDETLLAWVAARVDTDSAPVRCIRLEQLPLTPQGKLDRSLLARLAQEDVAAERPV